MIKRFQHYIQFERKDCGPTCLQMIAKHYGKYYSLSTLRDKCFITREWVSMLGISDAAETIGLRSIGVKITWVRYKNNHCCDWNSLRDFPWKISRPSSRGIVFQYINYKSCPWEDIALTPPLEEEGFKLWNIKHLHTLPLEEGVPAGGGSSNHYA